MLFFSLSSSDTHRAALFPVQLQPDNDGYEGESIFVSSSAKVVLGERNVLTFFHGTTKSSFCFRSTVFRRSFALLLHYLHIPLFCCFFF